jgi:hypothetical protein
MEPVFMVLSETASIAASIAFEYKIEDPRISYQSSNWRIGEIRDETGRLCDYETMRRMIFV